MAERKGIATKANPDRAPQHAAVVAALEALRAELGETAAWESVEHAVRAASLQAGLRVPAEDGAR